MFAVRLFFLIVLVLIGWVMGQIPANEANLLAKILAFSLLVTVPSLYLLPVYEAHLRDHPDIASIFALNFFLGWSAIGWVGALVWAFKVPAPNPGPDCPQIPLPPRASSSTIAVRTCPYCAEEILVAAIKCKHCGSDLVTDVGDLAR